MTPYYADDWLTIYSGDARTVMATMAADSVDCVVTSPPYWGLRDYGHDGQLGLERTPEEYVANMVAVFAEVRRVLKPSGTCWLNLGDSYAANRSYQVTDTKWTDVGNTKGSEVPTGLKHKDLVGIPWRVAFALQADGWYLRSDIIWSKPNPMPESVTDRPTKAHEYLFLLTKSARYYFDADAVRESVADATLDRLAQNVAEQSRSDRANGGAKVNGPMRAVGTSAGRNLRSVWTIATQPYKGAHFAVFPPELPERCIKAGSSEKGVCPECGAPWERVVERTGLLDMSRPQARRAKELADNAGLTPDHIAAIRSVGVTDAGKARVTQDGTGKNTEEVQSLADHAKSVLGGYYREFLLDRGQTTGWWPTCVHEPESGVKWHEDFDEGEVFESYRQPPVKVTREGLTIPASPKPAVILDPFAGSGTTGMVAQKLGRRAVLIDLNPDYLKQQFARNAQTPLGLTEGDAA